MQNSLVAIGNSVENPDARILNASKALGEKRGAELFSIEDRCLRVCAASDDVKDVGACAETCSEKSDPGLYAAAKSCERVYAMGLEAVGSNLLPRYGGTKRSVMQDAADKQFIAQAEGYFNGDRKKAASHVALTGWKYMRRGDYDGAMRRFNQAWLLDNSSGSALWGMAAYQAQSGEIEDALNLFAEAEGLVGNDLDFQADYARLLGLVGAQTGDKDRLQDAYSRFSRVHASLPQHIPNLQNWAITLYFVGDYAEAWKKIKEAEAAPQQASLDQNFIADLRKKMPRP